MYALICGVWKTLLKWAKKHSEATKMEKKGLFTFRLLLHSHLIISEHQYFVAMHRHKMSKESIHLIVMTLPWNEQKKNIAKKIIPSNGNAINFNYSDKTKANRETHLQMN